MSDSATRGGPGVSSPAASRPSAPRDRRATHRAAIEIPALLHVGTREVGCSIRDLSTQGIALVLKEGLAPGMVVRVGFRLPNSRQPVEVAGVLVRAAGGRGNATVGLQLVEPDADAVRVIETFVRRNRSDRPFSGRTRGGRSDTARVVTSESASSLPGLYKKAVGEVARKDGRRRGLLTRWLRRGKP